MMLHGETVHSPGYASLITYTTEAQRGSTGRARMEKNTAKKNPPQRANSAWRAFPRKFYWKF